MISLFIDTSLENVSISLLKDNKIISSISKSIPNMHSVYTTSFIKNILDSGNIEPDKVDDIYVVVGPGSFTGVRIGVTIAKVYGYLINKEIHPVSSLLMYALSTKYNGNILSIIPANKNSYYVSLCDNDYNVIVPEEFASSDRISELIDKYNPHVVGRCDLFKCNNIDLDIEKIVEYYSDKETTNYFSLVPNYRKLPQALEDKKC